MKKIMIMLIITFAITGIYSIENEYSLDLEKIKKMEHINHYKDNEGYVSFLNAEELFEFAYELVLYDEKNFESGVMLVLVQLNDKLDDDKNKELILELLKNKSYVPKYRAFLIDTAKKFIKKDSRLYVDYQDIILSIAKDVEVDKRLRKYAVSKLDSNVNDNLEEIINLLKSNNKKKISASLLHKLRRAKHPDLENYVAPVLNNPNEYDEKILQSAIMCLVPNFDIKYIGKLMEISENTENQKILSAIRHKLVDMNHPEAVIACLGVYEKAFKNADKFPRMARESFPYNLFNSINTIEAMIECKSNEYYQIQGLIALMKGKLPYDKEKILKLINSTNNEELQKMGKNVLRFLEENESYLASMKKILTKHRGYKVRGVK